MLLLRDYGTMTPARRTGAGDLLRRCRASGAAAGGRHHRRAWRTSSEKEWPTSHETWLPGGVAPEPHANVQEPGRSPRPGARILPRPKSRGTARRRSKRRAPPSIGASSPRRSTPIWRKAEVMDASGDAAQRRADRRRHGNMVGARRDAADLRLPWLDGRQDRPMGTGAGLSADRSRS